jgi:hypothetical protein
MSFQSCLFSPENVPVQELPAETSHRLGDRGFQETAVPEALGTVMLDYLTGLKFQYIVDVKELRIQSASSFRAAR